MKLRSRLPQVFLLPILLFTLSACSGCATGGYLIDAGLGQWRIMNRARPIEEILKNPNTSPETKRGIHLVGEAKKFSVDKLGLKATANYREFVQLDHPYASYVVTAAHPIRLEHRTWSFPIVGQIPYIGFFSPAKADAYAERLKTEPEFSYDIDGKKYAPDVSVRGASAYSTLGWLPDPLYSSMIQAGERRIVDTVIHESVHATVFIGSNMEFNERFANFVGLEGSLAFLNEKYGAKSSEIEQAKKQVAQEKIFAAFIDAVLAEYKNAVEKKSSDGVDTALAAKKDFYLNLGKLYLNVHAKERKKWPELKLEAGKPDFSTWNNAVLAGYQTYNKDLSAFEALFKKCDSSILRFMQTILKEYDGNKSGFAENPDETIRRLAGREHCL